MSLPALPTLQRGSRKPTILIAADSSQAVELTGVGLVRLDADSAFAVANAELHAAICAELDAGIDRLRANV